MLSFSVVSACPLWGLEWERAMMLFMTACEASSTWVDGCWTDDGKGLTGSDEMGREKGHLPSCDGFISTRV